MLIFGAVVMHKTK